MKTNKAEKFVEQLSSKSFLSLWGISNPIGEDNNNEICDFLVICDPYAIVFSVKDIQFKMHDNPEVAVKRWQKDAIDASVKQIYGAERYILTQQKIMKKDGGEWLKPSLDDLKVFRVSVSFASKGQTAIMSGDFGKGFVHVFDEISFTIILQELDTVEDFIAYLNAKELLFNRKATLELNGGEEDLLAIYLHNGRIFPENFDHMIIDKDIWNEFSKKDEYLAKKREDEKSYVWDNLIEVFSRDFSKGHLVTETSLDQIDSSLRVMAKENRFNRRILGKALTSPQ